METQERIELIQEALDFDEIKELRLAISLRRKELLKLKKKEGELGLDSIQINRRLRIMEGDETTPGLVRLIVQTDAYEDEEDVQKDDPTQKDAFFDEAKAVEEEGEVADS